MKHRTGFLLAALLFAAPSWADDALPPPAIHVNGEASAKITPDQVTLPVTAFGEDVKLDTAKEKSDQKLKQILGIAKELGVAPEKLQTLGTQVQPQYDYPPKGGKPVFRNYTVSVTVQIILSDTTKLAALMDALVKADVDRIGSAEFGLADPKKARDALLVQAVQDARAKAEKMATALGVKVGKPLEIMEQGGGMSPPPRPMYRMAAMAADSAEAAPPELPGGQMDIRQNVSVRFRLE